jgi:DNA polymerase III delta subunit
MIWTFTGKNSFALQLAVKKLVDDTINEVGEFGVERIDASDNEVDFILQAVQSLPFLVTKKLIIVSNIQSNTSLLDKIEALVDRVADGVDVVLVEPALDKRKSSYKQLQKLTELKSFSEPKPFELPSWVVDFAKQQSAIISKQDATYLIERVGANQQMLATEIQKLSTSSPKITKEIIQLLTDESIQHTIFSLLDASFSGDSEKAILLYREQRRASVEPQYIIAMLVWQLQSIAQAVYAPIQNEAALIEMGQSPYTAKKSLSVAKRLTRNDIKRLIIDVSELDAQIKTSADPDAGVELFLLRM